MPNRTFVVLVLSIFPIVLKISVPVATIHPAVRVLFTATSVTTATIRIIRITRIIRIIRIIRILTIRRRHHLRRTYTIRTLPQRNHAQTPAPSPLMAIATMADPERSTPSAASAPTAWTAALDCAQTPATSPRMVIATTADPERSILPSAALAPIAWIADLGRHRTPTIRLRRRRRTSTARTPTAQAPATIT